MGTKDLMPESEHLGPKSGPKWFNLMFYILLAKDVLISLRPWRGVPGLPDSAYQHEEAERKVVYDAYMAKLAPDPNDRKAVKAAKPQLMLPLTLPCPSPRSSRTRRPWA